MKAPKMLPWLASRAVITQTRAEALWAEAACYARQKTREVDRSERSQVAVSRFLELIEAEKTAPRSLQRGHAGRVRMRHSRFTLTSLHGPRARWDVLSELC